MATLRETQKAMTRELLLTSALELFETAGYAATTIDDIAAASGASRATFYLHFPSRRELMRAVLDDLNVRLGRIRSEHGTTEFALVDAVRIGTAESIGAWLRTRAKEWTVIKPYLMAAREAAAVDPEIRALVDSWVDEVIADIQSALDGEQRFPEETRYVRGELAVAQLDYLGIRWMRKSWDLDHDPGLDILTLSWVNLLGTGVA
jgi:AcrR family transcriptional regulator